MQFLLNGSKILDDIREGDEKEVALLLEQSNSTRLVKNIGVKEHWKWGGEKVLRLASQWARPAVVPLKKVIVTYI